MEERNIKIVGKRKAPETPEESFWRAQKLIAQIDLLNPYPRPRGFVAKFKTYEDYAAWRKAQENPRLW